MNKCLIIFSLLLMTKSENECINGKDPSKLSEKEYLIEFSKGVCSPFIIVPSMTGSKLIAQIDCEVFKKENLEVFQTCGWTDCKKEIYEFWKNVPDEEYILWYPNASGPMNLFSPFEQPGNCLASLIKLNVDFNKKIEDSILEVKGLKIKVYGNSEKTKTEGECGDKVISNMVQSSLEPEVTKMWNKFFIKAKTMGYKKGLTYQSIPYDWRKSYKNNKIEQIFIPNIKRLYNITNKKVVLMSHSFGVKVIYWNLLKMAQSEKNRFIRVWAGVGGNFLGSWFSNIDLVAGNNFFLMMKYFGLKINATIKLTNNILSIYEARIRDPFVLFEGEEWFENFKKRIEYENGNLEFENSGFDFLPKLTDECTSEKGKFDKSCVMGFFDSRKYFYMAINGKKYYEKDLDDLISNLSLIENSKNFIEMTDQKEFLKLKNPGVSYVGFITRTIPTPSVLIWNSDIKEYIKNNNSFYNPDKTIYSYGDETVSTTSLLSAPLKWAHEFTNKKKENIKTAESQIKKNKINNQEKKEEETDPKPIKIIDVCSKYNNKNNIYDNYNKNSDYKILKNEFIGINCEDFDKDIPSSGSHSNLIHDKFFIEFFGNILISNDISYNQDFEKRIMKMDNDELVKMGSNDCPQIIYEE